jgi:hypothetical protein
MSEASAGPHGVPDAAQLLESVAEFLRDELFAVTPEDHQFHLRVAVNVVDIVRREIALGPGQVREHQRRLAELGVADEEDLARRIRAGEISGEAVRAAVAASVRDKLRVANPSYLEEEAGS